MEVPADASPPAPGVGAEANGLHVIRPTAMVAVTLFVVSAGLLAAAPTPVAYLWYAVEALHRGRSMHGA